MTPAPPFAARAALAAATVLVVAAGSGPTASAAPAKLKTQTGPALDLASTEQLQSVVAHGDALLRADGSFGAFVENRSAKPNVQLLTYGRTGANYDQTVVQGTSSGALGYPRTALSGVAGYDWVFLPSALRPARGGEQADANGMAWSRATLVAVDDRGRTVKRVAYGNAGAFSSGSIAATGAGVRLVVRRNGDKGLLVVDSRGKTVARISHSYGERAVVGRADGIVMSIFSRKRPWSESLVHVSNRGKVSLMRDRRGHLISGDPVANGKRGVLIRAGYGQVVSLLSPSGTVTEQAIGDLDLPIVRSCKKRANADLSMPWAMTGPSGDPIIGITCTTEADRTSEVVEANVVGLDRNLRASWTVPMPISASGYDAPKPQLAPDGRLRLVGVTFEAPSGPTEARLVSWRAPNTPAASRGRLVSVARSGNGVVATIRCALPEGTVCAGTANVTRGGRVKTVRYAMKSRPGSSAAVIKRHLGSAPSGSGPLRVTLSR